MKDKKLNVRVPAALDAALEHACTNRDSTKRAAVMEALEAWLQKSVNSDTPYCKNSIANQKIPLIIENSSSTDGLVVTQQEAQCIGRVLEILRRGPPIARVALESNLGAFSYLSQIAGTEPEPHVGPADSVPDTPTDLQTALESVRRNEAKTKPVVERLLRAGEPVEGKGETATGTGGPVRPGRKPDPGSSGGRG